MDTYISKQLNSAKELLESGVQFGRPQLIQKAMGVYSNVKDITEENEEYSKNVRENMVRACSALCVFDPQNAMKYLEEAAKFDPNHPVVLNNFGYIYHTQYANWDKSIQNYEKCLLMDPKYVMAYLGIIDVYRTLRHHNLELEYCRKAISHCDDSPELWNSLGLALLHNHDYTKIPEMFTCLRKAMDLNPKPETKAKILVNIGHLHGILGDFSMAINHYLQAIESDKTHHPSYQNILLNLHYYSDLDFDDENLKLVMKRFGVTRRKGDSMAQVITSLHVEITKEIYGASYPESEKIEKGDISRKIVVGYVTSDLIDHAVSFFAKVLFNNYTKEGFDIYIYSNNVYDAGAIAEIPCTGYRCIKNATAADSVTQIKKDKVDILIDLSGHTSGNRLDIFALKPAPILLSYMGYPDDTGFPFMNRISDKFTERGNMLRIENDDKMAPIRLPRLFLCYTPKESYEKHIKSYIKFSPTNSTVNFGCFAKLQKINKHVISAWKVILTRVPNSRLLLKSRYFQDEKTLQIWKDKFGAVADRVIFLKGTNTAEKHMEMYNLIDIHLDTFPYSGTTITTESLYMNVPVITLAIDKRGIGHVQRVSGSILSSMGLEEDCVGKTVNEYVEKAVAMVQKLPNLPSVRKKFLSSDISKPKEFMKVYEKALSDLFVDKMM